MEYLMPIYLTDFVNAKPFNFPYYTRSNASSLSGEYRGAIFQSSNSRVQADYPDTIQLCRMQCAYHKSTTRVVSCKS